MLQTGFSEIRDVPRRHLNFPLNRGLSFLRCILYLKMAWMSTKDCVAAVLLCKQQAKEKRDQSWEDAALKLRPSAATGFVVTRPCMHVVFGGFCE